MDLTELALVLKSYTIKLAIVHAKKMLKDKLVIPAEVASLI